MGLKLEGKFAIITIFILIAFLLGSGIGISVGISDGDLKNPVANSSNNYTLEDLNTTKLPNTEITDDGSLDEKNSSNQNYSTSEGRYYSNEDLKNKGMVNNTALK
ncbi:MAG: hypothetical protein LBU40_04680 [Methanobrevibacter sp.]|jgi:hypothetical protein|nr:hypothetical protein [Methanobrevibacter sp.]